MTDKNTAFFMCDLQERFRKSIGDFTQIIEVSLRLLKASEILKDSVPLIVTEQVIICFSYLFFFQCCLINYVKSFFFFDIFENYYN